MQQIITLENLPNEAKIKVSCESTGEEPDGVTQVLIKKRESGTLLWVTIKSVPIATKSDFTFSFKDIYTCSRRGYDYSATPVKEGVQQVGVVASVECDFSGIYISDDTQEFMCVADISYDYQKNIPVTYQKTLTGRYPVRIKNGNANYATGSATGLFLPTSACGMPILDNAERHKESVLEFLCNGKRKLLKTYDGKMWTVGINDNPKEEFNEYIGASKISFQWTEIDSAPPSSGAVYV